MSRLDDLIKELCPNGVEYKRIDECYEIYSGMSGCSLKWKESGNCRFIDYKNAYNNLKIDVDDKPFATVKKLAQNSIRKNDILITTASEVPDECAITAVVEKAIEENVFLDDHLFGIHLIDESVNSTFVNYYMQTQSFRNAVRKKVKGVTRFFVSPSDIGAIFIPVPPLKVQEEIVKILDKFTDYVTELQAELQARKQQYEYYAEKLLINDRYPFEKLGDTCEMKAGKAIKASMLSNEIDDAHAFPCFGGNGIRGYINNASHEGDFPIIGRQGALCGNVQYATGKFYATEHAVVVQSKGKYDQRYLYYLLSSMNLNQYKSAGAQPGLAVKNIAGLIAPVPPIERQKRIADTLDRFDVLCTDISDGLPAEIEARQKQYEYYRDKLLSFKEIEL